MNRPEKPGWYWWRDTEWTAVKVSETDGILVAEATNQWGEDDSSCLETFEAERPGGHWGPRIEMPKEQPA